MVVLAAVALLLLPSGGSAHRLRGPSRGDQPGGLRVPQRAVAVGAGTRGGGPCDTVHVLQQQLAAA
ncbi:hypothetical protein FOA52_014777 [Chlamydomonas sp. UWO 241]|nr:hypothetical protein FOA52_014777 [Chlamydomonas sp. UWO 241]